MEKQNSFVKAGAVLVLSGFAVKILSALYRIPLTRMLGAVAMGRYSTIMSLFMPFFSLATGGVATCVAHFSALQNSRAGLAAIKSRALRLYMGIALVLSVAFAVFGFFYSRFQQDNIIFAGCLVLAPAVCVAVVENVYKGITQGQMNMLPTASAGILESLFKTVVGLLAVYAVKQYAVSDKDDLSVLACLVTVTLAGALCAAVMVWQTGSLKPNGTKPGLSCKDMLKMSVPIGMSALAMSVANFFDAAVCLPQIDKIPYASIVNSFDGASFKGAADMSMYLYGIWQGMALSVFNLVPALMISLGNAGLPVISSSWNSKNIRETDRHAEKLMKMSAALCVPANVFIFLFARQTVMFLFGISGAQAAVAQKLLRTVLLSGVFCCFVPVLNSVLYAMGRSKQVLNILLTACAARMIVSFGLCRVPDVNITAFAVSACIFYTIIFLQSIFAVKKQGLAVDIQGIFLPPAMSAAAASAAALGVNGMHTAGLPLVAELFFSGTVFSLVYLIILILCGFFVDK